jgi:hypothetical protein
MSPPRAELLAFLQAIKEQPEDDTPRLILADWVRIELAGGGSLLEITRLE